MRVRRTVGLGVGLRVGLRVATGVGVAGEGDLVTGGIGRTGEAVGDGDAATAAPSATAVPGTEKPRTGSATSAAEAASARTRAEVMARCYEASSRPRDNLLRRLRVGGGMRTAGVRSGGVEVGVDASAGDQLTALYASHYRELVRLAAFLTSDRDSAEEVVQDAYVKVHGSWLGVRELDKAEAYLRTTVVNLCRSRLRRRVVVARHRPEPLRDADSAETKALETVQRDAVLGALTALPRRQREAVVLRYYGDLTEAQTAAAMGCSVGSVKSHTSRGLAALRPVLEAGR